MKPTYRPSPAAFLVALMLWTVVAVLIFQATSCAGTASDLVEKMDTGPTAAATLDAPTPGHVRRFAGRTACRTTGNTLPWIHQLDGRAVPKANTWFALYGTRGTTPMRDERHTFAWVVSYSRHEPPFSTPLAPGCWLLVKPDAIMFCFDRPVSFVSPVDQRIAAWREGSHAMLILRPHPELVGRSIYVQLAMHAPGENFAEVLVSQGMELVVGS